MCMSRRYYFVLIYHTPMDMLRCTEFDCNVLLCNLLQFAPNFWFLKRHVYIKVLLIRVSKTDLFLNDSTVKQ